MKYPNIGKLGEDHFESVIIDRYGQKMCQDYRNTKGSKLDFKVKDLRVQVKTSTNPIGPPIGNTSNGRNIVGSSYVQDAYDVLTAIYLEFDSNDNPKLFRIYNIPEEYVIDPKHPGEMKNSIKWNDYAVFENFFDIFDNKNFVYCSCHNGMRDLYCEAGSACKYYLETK